MVPATNTKLGLSACVLMLIGLCSVAVRAELVGPMLVLDVTNGHGSGQLVIPANPNWYDPNDGSWHWQLPEPAQIHNPHNGAWLATLSECTVTVLEDPQVNLAFSVLAGDGNTLFQISTALLPLAPPYTSAEGRASAAFTITDGDSNGALLTGHCGAGGNKSYLAQYNGHVPNGTSFAEEIESLSAPPDGTGNVAVNVPLSGYLPIAGTVHNMSAGVDFILSGNDLASGTTNFEIIPELAAFALALLGGVLLRRR